MKRLKSLNKIHLGLISNLNHKVSFAKDLISSGFISPNKLKVKVINQQLLDDINSPRHNDMIERSNLKENQNRYTIDI